MVYQGSKVDPEQVLAIGASREIVKILQKSEVLWKPLERAWTNGEAIAHLPLSASIRGPVARLANLMKRWGWQWTTPYSITQPDGRKVHLINDHHK